MVGNPERAIEIVAIDHVVLRVADLERSLRFYCEVLGCREERRVDSLGLVQLRAGTALIDLVSISGELGRRGGAAPSKHGRNMDHFALRIASFDIDAIMASLRDHGIEVGEPKQRYGADGTGPSVYIVDPDGNGVELKGPPVHPS